MFLTYSIFLSLHKSKETKVQGFQRARMKGKENYPNLPHVLVMETQRVSRGSKSWQRHYLHMSQPTAKDERGEGECTVECAKGQSREGQEAR